MYSPEHSSGAENRHKRIEDPELAEEMARMSHSDRSRVERLRARPRTDAANDPEIATSERDAELKEEHVKLVNDWLGSGWRDGYDWTLLSDLERLVANDGDPLIGVRRVLLGQARRMAHLGNLLVGAHRTGDWPTLKANSDCWEALGMWYAHHWAAEHPQSESHDVSP
jgi:hypothetical protein